MAKNQKTENSIEEEQGSKKKKTGILRTVWRSVKWLMFLTVLLLGVVFYFRYGKDLLTMRQEAKLMVKLSDAESFHTVETSVIYDVHGEELRSLSAEKDIYYLSYKEIPTNFVNAMVAVEDRKFFSHKGIDAEGIGRAFVALMEHDGQITQGGSTITQQLAKNIFLSNEVTWRRKVIEAFVAMELEKKYSKNQIMEFYLNNIYFANGFYGINAAAIGYFQQPVDELSLSQICFLCAIPNNPTTYDPLTNMENTISRRNKILNDMLSEGYINELDYTRAFDEEIRLNMKSETRNNYVETYIFHEAARALMKYNGFRFQTKFVNDYERDSYLDRYNEMYVECQKNLYTGGYRIYTSMDLDMQEELQATVDDVLHDYQDKNEDGVYTFQGAAVCIDNETGYVNAIVGGREQKDIEGYTLNRAYQSPRQPGSSIKPLNVYTPAFEIGYAPESVIKVKDKNGKVSLSMDVRKAVACSNNKIASEVYSEITPKRGMSYLFDMEFKSLVKQDEEIMAGALGGFTYGVTTEEMAAAYSALANGGRYAAPTCIIKIDAANGENLVTNSEERVQIYESNAAAMMTSVLQGVLEQGGTASGYGLKGMHCAGKTGTTNKNYDGWFCGYTPYYTTAIWVGYDMPKQLKALAGNTYPAKIWHNFMSKLHENLEDVPFTEYISGVKEQEKTEEAKDVEDEDADDRPEKPSTESKKPTEEKPTEQPSTETKTETPTESPTTTEASTEDTFDDEPVLEDEPEDEE